MKTLTIGSTTFEIMDCEQCRDNKKGFFLRIIVSVESISMDALRVLLKDNKEDIIFTKEDGTVNTYAGFGLIGKFSCENDVMEIAQYANSELEAQLAIAQNKITEQNKTIETMQNTVAVQTVALQDHATAITEQTATLALQTETIKAQTEEIGFLSDLLLEVLMA